MRRRGGQEWATVALLPLVWVVGVVLLWRSRAWTTRDKLVGTLLLPGGLAYVEYLAVDTALILTDDCGEGCSYGVYIGPLGAVIVLLAAVVPVVTAIHLARRADLTRLG